MKKNLLLYPFAMLIIGIFGCDSFMIRDTIGLSPSKSPGIKYEISLITVIDDVPVSFMAELKRYLFSELSKRKLLGRPEDNPQPINIIVRYYRSSGILGNVESVVNIMKGEDVLRESDITTSAQKVHSIEDIAKIHAKDIVRFIAEEKKK